MLAIASFWWGFKAVREKKAIHVEDEGDVKGRGIRSTGKELKILSSSEQNIIFESESPSRCSLDDCAAELPFVSEQIANGIYSFSHALRKSHENAHVRFVGL